jgi:hypothetical protein
LEFILERKEKLPLETDREPRKSVAPLFTWGVVIWSFFVGEGESGVRGGVVF